MSFEKKHEDVADEPAKEIEHVDEEILRLSKRKEELEKKSKLEQISREKFQVNFLFYIYCFKQ